MTTPSESNANESPLPFLAAIMSFRRAFWAANVMEIFERLAYYGVRVVVPIYIASSEDPDGLHFSNAQKGTIFAFWALTQTLLPMFTGGFADRYGRKRTIAVSVAIKVVGYLLMATQRTYPGFMLGCLTLAAGTAVFKPGAWGTVVAGTNPRNVGVGWGIFYWLVNVGGFLGPPLAGYLHHFAWKWVFFSCAAIVSLNWAMLFSYDDEPGNGTGSPVRVFVESISKFFKRPRLIVFVLITSGFYVMFMQLYDALPNFIEEWTNSADVVSALGLRAGPLAHATTRGLQVPQEWMINLDSGAILIAMVAVAALVAKFDRLWVFFVGVLFSCAGLFLAGTQMSGFSCLIGILVFAVGEMIAAPKAYEYFGVIAPPGDEALYMGFANIPFAVGWTSGAYGAGILYDRLADKANLATRFLRDTLHRPGEIPRTDAMKILQDATHLDATGATELLWRTYHPYAFWYVFIAIGIASAVGMAIFARAIKGRTETRTDAQS